MGSVHPGLDFDLADKLRKQYKLKYFVETGTYAGRTAIKMAAVFPLVYTIEVNAKIRNDFVKNYGNITNIVSIHGDSATSLATVLREIDSPALIWLDAHWSRDLGYNLVNKSVCPVLDELKAIRKDGRDHVIAIDDVRLFDGSQHWPSILTVMTAALYKGRASRIIDDVMLSEPAKLSLS